MTNSDHTDDFESVSADPAAWYSMPQAILEDPQLRHAEKALLLDEWARDLADRATAADEGMVPDTPGLIDGDVTTQDRIIAARSALDEMTAEPAQGSIAARLWQRIAAVVQTGGSVTPNATE